MASPQTGIVRGSVRNGGGQALPKAQVTAVPSGGSFATSLPSVSVDKHGSYLLRLSYGRYRILAVDQSEGYLDARFSLGATTANDFPEVTVSPAEVTGADVVLRAKGGVLEGLVLDDPSNNPIQDAKVRILDAQHPEQFVETFTDSKGHFEGVVPEKPVPIQITAAGHSSVEQTDGRPFTVPIGERRTIIVQLSRE